jgi:excinuclease ABC subunit A
LKEAITVKGAREHNLKNIDIEIPRNQLIVFTGLSGSGKSSLAFDTIYAEGQRRYVESLSSYARQFLGQMDKPDVDYIEGLSPAISIDQKTTSHNPRSTVGTVTEIHDYLRLLYARVGVPHCPSCGREIRSQSIDQMVDQVMSMGEGTRLNVLAPVVRARKGEYVKLFEDVAKNGYVRVRVDGQVMEIGDGIKLEKNKKHDIDVVVDRVVVRPGAEARLAGSMETALALGDGLVRIASADGGPERLFSQSYACPDCGISVEEMTPRMFSFNSPYGACPTCSGLGTLTRMDEDLIIPDRSLSLRQGAIQVSGWNSSTHHTMAGMYLKGLAAHYGFSLDTPVKDLPDDVVKVLLYGTGKEKIRFHYERDYGTGNFYAPFEGILSNLERRYLETTSEAMKEDLGQYMSSILCPECGGDRLKKEVLAVTVNDRSIAEVSRMSVRDALAFFSSLALTEKERMIARQILKEIGARLGFLSDVGLNYLTLARAAGSLSGGESQRIRLATQIGSSLVGVLYILDEPSIGLHQRDNARLLNTLKSLRDLGNTLIVVEHDEETICAADHVLDIGPGAGQHGGRVVAQGTPADIIACAESVTGQYLGGQKKIPVPDTRSPGNGAWLTVKGARENNLKRIDVRFPLGAFTCVTGVSGSGKSSLVNHILHKSLAKTLNRAKTKPGAHDAITGAEHLDKVIDIDQSPIGRMPRSNPATYTGLFDLIRELYASTPDAKMRGYSNGRFSFNVKGGRCEACRGDGIIRIEMHFLPDVYVPCEVCRGKRYNRETLEVKYKEKNIADVLDMTVEDALEFFKHIPRIKRKLQTLYDVGLGYVRLGQPSTTLSGGEAQRIKLSSELSRKSTGRTLFILDEPTTGLHVADVARLVRILRRLQEGGNTIIVIEHNLDVIKTADYVVDLGPEGGDSGGEVIACGTPEEICAVQESYTGQWLKKALEKA